MNGIREFRERLSQAEPQVPCCGGSDHHTRDNLHCRKDRTGIDRYESSFTEGFGLEFKHFTTLWDRMGAWAPRRLSLDAWGEGVCRESLGHEH